MKDTTRFLHKSKKRGVKQGTSRKYGLHQHAWSDESFTLIPFTGKFDKTNNKDMLSLTNAVTVALGPSYNGGGVFGSSWWSIERIFSFSNSGVVVVSQSYSIPD